MLEQVQYVMHIIRNIVTASSPTQQCTPNHTYKITTTPNITGFQQRKISIISQFHSIVIFEKVKLTARTKHVDKNRKCYPSNAEADLRAEPPDGIYKRGSEAESLVWDGSDGNRDAQWWLASRIQGTAHDETSKEFYSNKSSSSSLTYLEAVSGNKVVERVCLKKKIKPTY